MMNILVVEDEMIERKAITDIILKHLKKSIGMVISAENSAQACDLFHRHEIDLIISDINVPGLSGLEMLKILKQEKPECRAIILTGYDYFEYAQEAIRIGVDDFILKPVSQRELCDRLEKVISLWEGNQQGLQLEETSRFREIQSILQSDLIYAILYNDSPQHIARYFTIFQMEVRNAFCVCINHDALSLRKLTDIRNYMNEQGYIALFEIYFDTIVLFIFHTSMMNYNDCQMLVAYIVEVAKQNIKIGVGGIKTSINDFNQSFLEAQYNLKNNQMMDKHQFQKMVSYDNWSVVVDQYVNDVLQGIKENKTSTAVDIAEALYNYLQKQKQSDKDTILHTFFQNLKQALEQCVELQMYQDYIQDISWDKKAVAKQEERIYLMYTLKKFVDPLLLQKRKQVNKLILDAYAYIEKNYMHAIGLNDVAKHLNVTPQYISFLLSSGAQNSFTNILATYRIEKAKEYLHSDKKIKEIASLVGFQNQNYFAKTFKKITGQTPKEYKNLISLR